MEQTRDYEFLEHTADLRFRAYGKTLEDCFRNAVKALSYSMTNPDRVEERIEKKFEKESEDLPELLHDTLTELLFLFDTQSFLARDSEIKIDGNGPYALTATFHGEELDIRRHKLKAEIKAVTYHEMTVKKERGTWTAEVLCDI